MPFKRYWRLRELDRKYEQYWKNRDADPGGPNSRDWDYEMWLVESEINWIRTAQLLRTARRYDIPLPDRAPNIDSDLDWSMDQAGAFSLTRSGRTKVLDAIREERRNRREYWAWLVPIVFGLVGAATGIIGALTGLVAVLGRH
jgi:hypothetical protein